MLWAWLADFLSAALQGRALYVSYLSASPVFSFCQLPSNKMVSHEGGGRVEMETDHRKRDRVPQQVRGIRQNKLLSVEEKI